MLRIAVEPRRTSTRQGSPSSPEGQVHVKDRRRVQKDKDIEDHRRVQKDKDTKDRRRVLLVKDVKIRNLIFFEKVIFVSFFKSILLSNLLVAFFFFF